MTFEGEPPAHLQPYRGKRYFGQVLGGVPIVDVYKGDANLGPLKPQPALWASSYAAPCPECFAWGVGGERCNHLALAILSDALGSDGNRAADRHVEFRRRVLDKLVPGRSWSLTFAAIDLHLAAIDDEIDMGARYR